jgi:hypothetical protein
MRCQYAMSRFPTSCLGIGPRLRYSEGGNTNPGRNFIPRASCSEETALAVNLQGVSLPQGATLAIRIELTAQANITPFVAQQKVTRFVITEISSQLRGDTPDLHVSERLCWSVPVVLTSPARGNVGRVGEILVDAVTGEVLADADAVQRMAEHAERLAQRSPL